MNDLGHFFQIRDDYMNLQSDQVSWPERWEEREKERRGGGEEWRSAEEEERTGGWKGGSY